MAILDKLFGRKKSIKNLSLNDLQAEKVRLEELERRSNKGIEKLEGDKARLFKRGAGEPSKRQKIIVARKIKELDEQVKEEDRNSAMLSQQIRAVNGFVSMKRKESRLRDEGLWEFILQMDATELEALLTGGKVSNEINASKIKQMLGILETETEMSETLEEDADTMKLVALMEQAGESGHIDEKLAEAEEVLKKRDEEKSESV